MNIASMRAALQGEPVAIHATAPRQFHDDFELVAVHYQLREIGEYDQAKQAARNDLENAIPTFAALAGEIRDNAQVQAAAESGNAACSRSPGMQS